MEKLVLKYCYDNFVKVSTLPSDDGKTIYPVLCIINYSSKPIDDKELELVETHVLINGSIQRNYKLK